MESTNNKSAVSVNTDVQDEVSEPKVATVLTVYKKKSTFKGATETDFWYSATRSDGNSVMCKFKCPIESQSSAFEISNIIGNFKQKQVEVKGETYINYTYYIQSCDFKEIDGEPLPI